MLTLVIGGAHVLRLVLVRGRAPAVEPSVP